MGFFKTIDDLMADLLGSRDKAILANQEIIKADLLSIKAYLGVPDVRIGATQAELDQLGARIKGETDVVTSFDQSATRPLGPREPPPSG